MFPAWPSGRPAGRQVSVAVEDNGTDGAYVRASIFLPRLGSPIPDGFAERRREIAVGNYIKPEFLGRLVGRTADEHRVWPMLQESIGDENWVLSRLGTANGAVADGAASFGNTRFELLFSEAKG